MATGHGRVDYLLYVDQRVVGVIEAKPEGTPLSGVEWQSAMGLTVDDTLNAWANGFDYVLSLGEEARAKA
jgi:type I site-specific restriction endonuclease